MLIPKMFLSWMKKNVTPRRLNTNRRQRMSTVPLERLEERTLLTPVFVVDAAGTTLSSFDSATPAVALSAAVAITGLQAGEQIEGIDFRPATGQLYALGIVDGAGVNDSAGRIYTINTTTGAATQVGSTPFISTLTDGAFYGFDFNPRVDRIRIVSNADVNLRVNPNDGALAGTDTPLAFVTGDSNFGDDPAIVAAAYDQNVTVTGTTTLYGIDFFKDILVRQGSVNASPDSPNTGKLTTIGSTGVVATGTNGSGFDILDGTATGFTSITDAGPGPTKFYSINLSTGAATLVGNLLSGAVIMPDLALLPAAAPVFVGTTIVLPGTANADTVVVTATGANSGNYSLNGAPAVSFSGITAFTFNGLAGNDTLTINNPAAGLFAPAGGIFYDGGTQTGAPGDSLQILGGAHTGETHTFLADGANGHNGTIALVGGATANYAYSNLSPVLVNAGTPATVVFNLLSGNGNDMAQLENDTPNVANISRLRSLANTFEQTDFVTPTTSLTINLGNDGESYFQQAVDASFTTPNIAVNGGTGANTFGLLATPTGVTTTITGNILLDTVNIGSAGNSLDTILGAVVFNDAAGVFTDVLNILDQGDAGPNTYVLNVSGSNGTISRTATPLAALITYNDKVDLVDVKGGLGVNTYNVVATPATATTTITGNTAQDIVNIGATSNSLDAILGAVIYNDVVGDATDALNILDQGDASANTYVASLGSFPYMIISRAGAAFIAYNQFVNFVAVNGGTGANIYDVRATPVSAATTINGGAAQDIVSIGSFGTNSLDAILGAVTFNDAAGANATDTLNINDQGDAGPNTYVLDVSAGNGTILRSLTPAAALITYNANVNVVEVKGGLGVNTYNVLGTPVAATTTITGGALQDIVSIGSAANSLDTVLGAVVFNDNAAANTNDTLNINDQGDTTANDYTINATTIDRDGAGAGTSITYNANVNILVLNSGAGVNLINVAGTSDAIASLTVNSGAGTDTINVNGPGLSPANTVAGIYNFNGEADNDKFFVTPAPTSVAGDAITVDGGLPATGSIPGDALLVSPLAATTTLTNAAGTGNYNTPGIHQQVNFVSIETLGPCLTLPNASNTVRVSCDVNGNLVIKLGSTVIFSGLAMGTNNLFERIYLEGGSQADRVILESSLNGCFTGEVVVNGNGGNDKLDASGTSVNVKFSGGAGNDILIGGNGNDSLDGGAGNDKLTSGGGNDTLHGDAGNDGLDAGSGDDQAFGGDGNDAINGGSGNDKMFGETGNDTLGSGSGNDIQVGGDGNDKLTGGSGGSLLIGGTGSDMLTGGSEDDILIAGNTDFDPITGTQDFDADIMALMNILAEWTSVGGSYEVRIDHLRGTTGGGLNGTSFLTAATVHDDSPSHDALKGLSGRDWFFARTVPTKRDNVSGRVTGPVQLAEALDEI